MIAAGLTARSPAYDERGFTIVRGLIGTELADHLAGYVEVLAASGAMGPDQQVPGSLRRYGAPAFEALLAEATPVFSTVIGRRLAPTYSFVRLYRRGQDLAAHRDRSACEHSATVHLAASGPGPWPLGLRLADQDPQEVILGQGDAAVYQGTRVLHWREPLDHDWYLQVFLHYVDLDGPHARLALDGRPHLGAPPEAP